MPKLTYSGREFDCAPGETVLQALERQGEAIAHSCRSGVCQSCRMRAAEGTPPADAQRGLKENYRAQGDFLACIARPETDLVLASPGDCRRTLASIISLTPLSESVLQVRLAPEQRLPYRPGQYVTFLRPGLSRSYSIASLPEEDALEFHVRRVEAGRMSTWLHDQARPGDSLTIQGPMGDCFYAGEQRDQPLLLAGTGAGLAPLFGIVRDALRSGHSGEIRLYHGARNAQGLYLVEELRALAERYPQLRYHPVTDPLEQTLLQGGQPWKGWRGYFCGDPALVNSLRKRMFLAGMSMRDIFADAFVPATPAG